MNFLQETRFNITKTEKLCSEVLKFNSARNSLRYIIRIFNIKEIYIPFYTCPVVWQSVRKENCKIKFYHIDEAFSPKIEFPKDAFILYTNYFGVCAKNVRELSVKYPNLIVDNAHAFYMGNYGIASFNSWKKFFDIQSGSCLYHNGKCNIDIMTKSCYEDNIISEISLKKIKSIDFEDVKQKRLENFKILESKLDKSNELHFSLNNEDVPMVYPYLIKDEKIRKKLTKNNINIEMYWNPLPQDIQEGIFQRYILPLPISQTYNKSDMNKILEIING